MNLNCYSPKEEIALSVRVRDEVLISSILYTVWDSTYLRLVKLIEEGKSLPINLSNQVLYYTIFPPSKPEKFFGSPTNGYRRDKIYPFSFD
ncbi:hypothetical protein HQ584_01685 [Patescibacteria group bacterium]|nr:hypothetical protein [Patescibacteria group bacterium]